MIWIPRLKLNSFYSVLSIFGIHAVQAGTEWFDSFDFSSDTGEIFATMRAGDFFGEIGILNLEGGINR